MDIISGCALICGVILVQSVAAYLFVKFEDHLHGLTSQPGREC